MKGKGSKTVTTSDNLDDIHSQGEEILAQAQQLFAKAQQAQGGKDPSEDDLEEDFEGLNEEPEDEEEDDEEEETPPPAQGKMAKATQVKRGSKTVHVDEEGTEFIDATEQLSVLNGEIRDLKKMVKAQNSQMKQLMKVVGLQQQSIGLMAKAQGGMLNTPQRSKVGRATVATRTRSTEGGNGSKKLDLNGLFAKAYNHKDVGEDLVGILDSARQRGDAQTFLQYLPADLRAEALADKE